MRTDLIAESSSTGAWSLSMLPCYSAPESVIFGYFILYAGAKAAQKSLDLRCWWRMRNHAGSNIWARSQALLIPSRSS